MFRFIFAIVLIGFGTMLVLANIGILDFNFGIIWHHLYPFLIFGIGLKWLFDYLRKRGMNWFLGIAFVLFGGLLILDRFDVIVFKFNDIYKLWPLLIVYLGFNIIGIGTGRGKRTCYGPWEGNFWTDFWSDKNSGQSKNFMVGSQDYSQPNWKVEPMNINSLAGDFYLDFSKAFIPEKEVPISIQSLAGDVHILIPENVEFRILASVKAGEINILGNAVDGINRSYEFETENYHDAIQKIDFLIRLKAGSIRVNQI